MNKYMDTGTLVVSLITLALFIAALFFKGVGHDIFLEAGIFLVSVKLFIMAYKTRVLISEVDAKLDRIIARLPPKE